MNNNYNVKTNKELCRTSLCSPSTYTTSISNIDLTIKNKTHANPTTDKNTLPAMDILPALDMLMARVSSHHAIASFRSPSLRPSFRPTRKNYRVSPI